MEYRVESDSIGSKKVPTDAYYGIQSMRGTENFPITGRRLRPEFIESIAQIKKACALCNHRVGELDSVRKDAIIRACDEIIAGVLTDQFICDPIQGGAGPDCHHTGCCNAARIAAFFDEHDFCAASCGCDRSTDSGGTAAGDKDFRFRRNRNIFSFFMIECHCIPLIFDSLQIHSGCTESGLNPATILYEN